MPDGKYPLKLVSPTFEVGGPSVAQVVCIKITGTTAPTHPVPTVADWPLELYGALSHNVTQAEFESAVSSYGLSYTDNSGTWTGIALWRLVALVDDDNPATFNSASAAAGYSVWVAAPDYYYVFDSVAVAGNNDIIAANTLNGNPLPPTDPSNSSKLWYPVKLVGSGLHSGDRVGGVAMIELLNLPASPPSTQPGWDLNADHVCNISDVVKIGLRWGQTGTSGWIPEDLNNDGVINISDVVVLGLLWEQTW